MLVGMDNCTEQLKRDLFHGRFNKDLILNKVMKVAAGSPRIDRSESVGCLDDSKKFDDTWMRQIRKKFNFLGSLLGTTFRHFDDIRLEDSVFSEAYLCCLIFIDLLNKIKNSIRVRTEACGENKLDENEVFAPSEFMDEITTAYCDLNCWQNFFCPPLVWNVSLRPDKAKLEEVSTSQ